VRVLAKRQRRVARGVIVRVLEQQRAVASSTSARALEQQQAVAPWATVGVVANS
jgi:hypothetical protein